MPIYSMTGFGQAEISMPSGIYRVEISSVNNRYLNFQIRLPRTFACMEQKVKKFLTSKINRGSVSVVINWSKEDTGNTLSWNRNIVKNYVSILKEIKKEHGLKDDVSLSHLLNFSDIVEEENAALTEETLWKHLKKVLQTALMDFMVQREKEATYLINEIKKIVRSISRTVKKIEKRAPLRIKRYRVELEKKLEQLINKSMEPSRLAIEVALMADRLDITEECTRLHAYIEKMDADLNSNEPIGKRLGFILQEMNREANTIGSKANDTKISFWSVELKENIEKIREQVLNIE